MMREPNSWRGLLSRDRKSRKPFHVKRSEFESFAVSRETSGFIDPLFHVKRDSLVRVNRLNQAIALLSDTELAKDHVQDVLDVHPAEQPPQGRRRGPQILRRQFLTLPDRAQT